MESQPEAVSLGQRTQLFVMPFNHHALHIDSFITPARHTRWTMPSTQQWALSYDTLLMISSLF